MSITGAGRLAGVLGWPVDHSLSPRLHGYWLERYKIDGELFLESIIIATAIGPACDWRAGSL